MTRGAIAKLVLNWPSVHAVHVLESFDPPTVVVIVRGNIHPTTMDAIGEALGSWSAPGVPIHLFNQSAAVACLLGAVLQVEPAEAPSRLSWWEPLATVFAATILAILALWAFLHNFLSPVFAGGLG